jgi:hypothetical protein
VFDPTIVRGLDYYTGTVFETFLDDAPGFGSVMSGGRYDGLVGLFSSENVPAVGISVGIDRLIQVLDSVGLLRKSKSSASVLVTVFDPSCLEYSLRIAGSLRRAGIPTEVFLDAEAKLKKQLSYAQRKEIPLCVIAGPEEIGEGVCSLRDMRDGSQRRVKLEQLAQTALDTYVDPDPTTSGRSWDWAYTDESIERVPDVGGVFILRGEAQRVLFVGAAQYGNLRYAIKNSVSPAQRARIRNFDWYEIRDEALARGLAEFLISRLKPDMNT